MGVVVSDVGRYALVVAESEYRDAKLRRLRAPAADAERLAAVLEDPDVGGFAVEVAMDETEPELRRRIARFFAGRKPDDLLLVHFSCHGVKDEGGELYLAASDTEVGDLLSATGISSSWLSEQIGRSRSKRVVVLLDCCFSGSFPFGMRARATGQVDMHEYLEGRGRAVITASSAMEYAYEGDELSGEGHPSIFTEAVVQGLETGEADRDGDRWISVDDLYGYVYDRVKERTPWQNPNKLSNLEGPLHIARSVLAPLSAEDPATAEDAASIAGLDRSSAPPSGRVQRAAATLTTFRRQLIRHWQSILALTVFGLLCAGIAAIVGAAISYPLNKHARSFAAASGVLAILYGPIALALASVLVLARRAALSLPRALAAAVSGVALAAIGSNLVARHALLNPVDSAYYVWPQATAGAAIAFGAILPRLQVAPSVAGVLAGATGGALGGLVEHSILFGTLFTGVSGAAFWIVEWLLVSLVMAAPVCLVIALLAPRNRQLAALRAR